MTAPWTTGKDSVSELIRRRHIETLTGESANGEAHLDRADATLASAEEILKGDPPSSLNLAYDSYRTALAALLAQQGLRVTTDGGHVAYGEAARAQFPNRFPEFDHLRRMRNRTEYPRSPSDMDVSEEDAQEACAIARQACTHVRDLLPHLGLWR